MATATATLTPQVDLQAVKARQQGAWSSGDYAIVGTTLQIVGEELCEALDLRAGQKVLDVAAGNGNATLAAARRWCEVVSTDYVPALARARPRARRGRAACRSSSRRPTPRRCPSPTPASTSSLSTFGVMFTPDQDKRGGRADARRASRGGKIGMANWTPEGFIGQLFKTLGKHLPPPAGVKSPALWGTRGAPRRRCSARRPPPSRPNAAHFAFRYRSPEHLLDVSRPITVRCSRPSPPSTRPSQRGLGDDLLALIGRMNRAEDGTMVVPANTWRS